jgi:hypothetical protein
MELKQAIEIIKKIGETTSNAEIKITFNDQAQVDSMRIPLDDANMDFLYSVTKVLYATGLEFQFNENYLIYTDFKKEEEPASNDIQKTEAKP